MTLKIDEIEEFRDALEKCKELLALLSRCADQLWRINGESNDPLLEQLLKDIEAQCQSKE